MHAVRRDPTLQRFYRRKLLQKGLGKARIAAARKLGIRLWIMLRDQIDYDGVLSPCPSAAVAKATPVQGCLRGSWSCIVSDQQTE